MTDNLDQLAGQMVALFRQAVPLANSEVDALVQSGERDTQRIEHQLDHMLGFCCDPDMPSQSMVFRWLADERYTSFREQYARAREEQADTNADEILSIADEMPPEYTDDKGRTSLDQTYLAWQKQRIEARKWTAMKLKPKKYGDKLGLHGVEGAAPIATQDATASKFEEIIRNMEMTKRAG